MSNIKANNLFNRGYSSETKEKMGNTLIYLSERIPNLSKTKALKLLYILDKDSIQSSGIPFLNLEYKVWKFGPVAEEIYIELSSEPSFIDHYITLTGKDPKKTYIESINDFNDDEFSDRDIELMDSIIKKYKTKTAKELVKQTHSKGSLWYKLAKQNGVLSALENEEINHTDIVINLSELLSKDKRKAAIYQDYIEQF